MDKQEDEVIYAEVLEEVEEELDVLNILSSAQITEVKEKIKEIIDAEIELVKKQVIKKVD